MLGYKLEHREVEVKRGVFEHPCWQRVRATRPDLYDECRAAWLTCLEIWGYHQRVFTDWNGLIPVKWLRRQLPDCGPALGVLRDVGLLVESQHGDLCMPYFPKRRVRSVVDSSFVWRVDLDAYEP
jgi:hypothetical protein